MKWLKNLFDSSSKETGSQSSVPTVRVDVHHPLIIRSPRIGFLNLIGPSAETILREDKEALAPLFASVNESEDKPPLCDVLMIYAQLQKDGRIQGSSSGLREIIRDARAPVAIMAAENDPQSYIAAAKRTGYGQANLVMTLKRKGSIFPSFFRALFEKMSKGKSMPLAWVELAPQVPGTTHNLCPEAIFSAEISHIVFE